MGSLKSAVVSAMAVGEVFGGMVNLGHLPFSILHLRSSLTKSTDLGQTLPRLFIHLPATL